MEAGSTGFCVYDTVILSDSQTEGGPQEFHDDQTKATGDVKGRTPKKRSPGLWPGLARMVRHTRQSYFSRVILFAAWKSPVLIL